jgi:hypothetical protein
MILVVNLGEQLTKKFIVYFLQLLKHAMRLDVGHIGATLDLPERLLFP